MLNYLRQVEVCGSVRKMIEQAFAQSDDMGIRYRTSDIPTTESILRAASLYPSLDTEEKLKDFMIKHVLGSLRLTTAQRERLKLDVREPESLPENAKAK